MLGNAVTPHDDNDIDFEGLDEALSFDDSVPGLPGLLMGVVKPKPYPINIYNFDGQKESGIAGTLFPDGTFVPLPTVNGLEARHWNEGRKTFLEHEVVWDGIVAGGVELSVDPEQPHTRKYDGSVTGPWPLHPPKPDRLVSVEGARAAALENEKDSRSSQGGVL